MRIGVRAPRGYPLHRMCNGRVHAAGANSTARTKRARHGASDRTGANRRRRESEAMPSTEILDALNADPSVQRRLRFANCVLRIETGDRRWLLALRDGKVASAAA